MGKTCSVDRRIS